jgi:hypothetical protein
VRYLAQATRIGTEEREHLIKERKTMKFLSIELDTPFGLNGWFEHRTDMDTASFDASAFGEVRSFVRSLQGREMPCRGADMNCFEFGGKNLRKCHLSIGSLDGFLHHMAYTDDDSGRYLYHMNHYGVSTKGCAPILLNAVLPDTSDSAETEAQARAVESLLSVGHVVKTIEGIAVGDEYPRFGSPEEHDKFIQCVLRLRPVHLWLPSRLVTSAYGEITPMTTPRTLPKNDKYLRHIQPIMERARTVCAMYAAATILHDEKTHSPCIPALPPDYVARMLAMANLP